MLLKTTLWLSLSPAVICVWCHDHRQNSSYQGSLKCKNMNQRTAQLVLQTSGMSWTCPNTWTQYLGLLPASPMLEMIWFQPSEFATPPCEHDTSSSLDRTTKSDPAIGQIAPPPDKTVGEIHRGNITTSTGGDGRENWADPTCVGVGQSSNSLVKTTPHLTILEKLVVS
jgi:hypothetical protein